MGASASNEMPLYDAAQAFGVQCLRLETEAVLWRMGYAALKKEYYRKVKEACSDEERLRHLNAAKDSIHEFFHPEQGSRQQTGADQQDDPQRYEARRLQQEKEAKKRIEAMLNADHGGNTAPGCA